MIKEVLQQRGIVLTMAIGIFLCMLDTTVMNIALPAIQTGLKTDLGQLSWALNIYTVLFASLTIPLGRMADIYGRSRVYLLGLGLFLAGSIFSGLALNVGLLIIGRGVQSIGAAIVFPASMTIGIQNVTLAERRNTIAILGVTQGLAAALGPTIGGIVVQFIGWRGIFLINVPFILMAMLLCWRLLDFKETRQAAKLDILGSLWSMVVLFALTLTLIKGSDWGWRSPKIISLISLSCVALILFILTERRTAQPMMPLRLFRDRQFVGASIVTIISGIFLVAVLVLLPSFFTKVQHHSELMAALMITPTSAMIFIWSPISGLLLEKIGPRLVMLTGSLAIILGYVALSFVDFNVYGQILLGLLLIGTGYGIIIGPITILAAGDFTGELLTASQSVIGVFRQIGTSLAVAIFVTALSTNLVSAQQTVWQSAQQEINQLAVPKPVKQQTLAQVNQQIFAAQSNEQQPTNKRFINKTQEKRLVAQQYQQVVRQQHLDKQPSAVQASAYRQTQQQVRAEIRQINQQLAQSIKKIKSQMTRALIAAFKRPYQVAMPFTLLLVACVSLFSAKLIKHD
ncbi:MFS transporter [Lapidilactobacillus wuchangensis]|uniref:MFS transporter n=1 Tax=Lapidilactobacillus wuchangensis TaxID=2486001 RepID=UPI000F78A72D|nr:MFS transporter [Lapidilactobacillus wuchangensis]